MEDKAAVNTVDGRIVDLHTWSAKGFNNWTSMEVNVYLWCNNDSVRLRDPAMSEWAKGDTMNDVCRRLDKVERALHNFRSCGATDIWILLPVASEWNMINQDYGNIRGLALEAAVGGGAIVYDGLRLIERLRGARIDHAYEGSDAFHFHWSINQFPSMIFMQYLYRVITSSRIFISDSTIGVTLQTMPGQFGRLRILAETIPCGST